MEWLVVVVPCEKVYWNEVLQLWVGLVSMLEVGAGAGAGAGFGWVG